MKVINSSSLGIEILMIERGDSSVPEALKHLPIYNYLEITALKESDLGQAD